MSHRGPEKQKMTHKGTFAMFTSINIDDDLHKDHAYDGMVDLASNTCQSGGQIVP